MVEKRSEHLAYSLKLNKQPPHYAVLVRGLLAYPGKPSVSRSTIRYSSTASTASSSASAFVTAFDASATALVASASASSAASVAL